MLFKNRNECAGTSFFVWKLVCGELDLYKQEGLVQLGLKYKELQQFGILASSYLEYFCKIVFNIP